MSPAKVLQSLAALDAEMNQPGRILIAENEGYGHVYRYRGASPAERQVTANDFGLVASVPGWVVQLWVGASGQPGHRHSQGPFHLTWVVPGQECWLAAPPSPQRKKVSRLLRTAADLDAMVRQHGHLLVMDLEGSVSVWRHSGAPWRGDEASYTDFERVGWALPPVVYAWEGLPRTPGQEPQDGPFAGTWVMPGCATWEPSDEAKATAAELEWIDNPDDLDLTLCMPGRLVQQLAGGAALVWDYVGPVPGTGRALSKREFRLKAAVAKGAFAAWRETPEGQPARPANGPLQDSWVLPGADIWAQLPGMVRSANGRFAVDIAAETICDQERELCLSFAEVQRMALDPPQNWKVRFFVEEAVRVLRALLPEGQLPPDPAAEG